MIENNFCVIMAGGVGSRFWPLSTTDRPKQFLDILGIGKSLLRLTYERFTSICPDENFYIVTNKIYKDLVLEQLPELNESQVLLEPMRRNTAPCIQYANYEISKRNKRANIVVAPSDHLIVKEAEFLNVISKGLDFVENNKALLTLGITPHRPDTGYGYIQTTSDDEISQVKTFTEKPDIQTAKMFLESGEFLWNSGIFIWNLETIENAFLTYLSEVYNLFQESHTGMDETEFINKTYAACPNISIDYGIMEKADNVYVYRSDFGWSDLGTWGSLYENTNKDISLNSLISGEIMQYDCTSSVVYVPKDKLAVVQGLDDFIVVDSGAALLICKKSEEQKIKQFVTNIQMKLGDSFI